MEEYTQTSAFQSGVPLSTGAFQCRREEERLPSSSHEGQDQTTQSTQHPSTAAACNKETPQTENCEREFAPERVALGPMGRFSSERADGRTNAFSMDGPPISNRSDDENNGTLSNGRDTPTREQKQRSKTVQKVQMCPQVFCLPRGRWLTQQCCPQLEGSYLTCGYVSRASRRSDGLSIWSTTPWQSLAARFLPFDAVENLRLMKKSRNSRFRETANAFDGFPAHFFSFRSHSECEHHTA